FVGFILIVIRFIWQIITEYTCFLDLNGTLVPGEFAAELEQKSTNSLVNTSAIWKEAYSTRWKPKAETLFISLLIESQHPQHFFSSITVTLNLTWARINQQGVVKRDYPPVRHVAYQSVNWLTKHILGGSPSRQARAHSSGADSAGLRLNSAVALVEKSKCLNGDLGLGLTTVLLAANEG
uniref:Uncharacterized protein n=1 Tax=Glossina palpalis gambiensis TaxID=67801 RepID=A0A1B0AMG5_9MUSC